jgi:hypothetical protein
MKIEKANVADAKSLTALTIRSNGYWKYGAELLEKWR